jgi:hypothetical protein
LIWKQRVNGLSAFTERLQPKLCACLYLSQKQCGYSVAVPVSVDTLVASTTSLKTAYYLDGEFGKSD